MHRNVISTKFCSLFCISLTNTGHKGLLSLSLFFTEDWSRTEKIRVSVALFCQILTTFGSKVNQPCFGKMFSRGTVFFGYSWKIENKLKHCKPLRNSLLSENLTNFFNQRSLTVIKVTAIQVAQKQFQVMPYLPILFKQVFCHQCCY